MKKLLITGGQGKLATKIIKANKEYHILAPGKNEMDITCLLSVTEYMDQHNPDIVLHAGAYTRPMSKHQENADVSIKTNIIGTCNIVLSCIERQCKLVYISTDYVYPGTQGNYDEDSSLSPYAGNNDGLTKYGWSKLGGECAVKMYDNSLILRACICDRPFPHKKAAVDVKKSLLFNDEAAEIILKLLGHTGIINVGGPAGSVYDFAIKNDSTIEKLSRKDIKDVNIAPDTTMDISKLNSILYK
jgi:dTDP-4-dehydrorhamnose reductase